MRRMLPGRPLDKIAFSYRCVVNLVMNIQLTPIATVKNTRTSPGDDFWGGTISEIELDPAIPAEAFDGIGSFSHLEIIYYFNQVGERKGDQVGERKGI